VASNRDSKSWVKNAKPLAALNLERQKSLLKVEARWSWSQKERFFSLAHPTLQELEVKLFIYLTKNF
jgi:hypothetical protein